MSSGGVWAQHADHLALLTPHFACHLPPSSQPLPACLPCLLPAVMVDAFQSIWDLHLEDKIPLRTAAFVIALQRVTRARVHRGFD